MAVKAVGTSTSVAGGQQELYMLAAQLTGLAQSRFACKLTSHVLTRVSHKSPIAFVGHLHLKLGLSFP